MVNSDHVPLRFARNTNFNPVYLRNAMVDLLTRPREENTMSTDVVVRTEEAAELVPAVSVKKRLKPVEANIDHMADHYKKLIKARADAKQLKAYIEALETMLKHELNTLGATDGKIKGAVVVTYRPKETFRLAEFREDHPEIYDKYLVPATTYVLDQDKLLADHAGMLEDYRSSAFNIK